MNNSNQSTLEQLQKLLSRKRSNEWLANELQISVEEVKQLKRELRDFDSEEVSGFYPVGNSISISQEESLNGIKNWAENLIKNDIDKGTIEITAYYDHPPTAEEVIKDHQIDEEEYKLSSFWSKGKGDRGWLVSAFFTKKKHEDKFQENFIEFLESWKSPHKNISRKKYKKISFNRNNSCLIFNKQDAHYNKYDVSGDNDISDRFKSSEQKVDRILEKALITSNLNRIIYIIGSDEFNSEWTSQTTKGTPQQNILPYQVSFQAVCYHEVNIINKLLESADNVDIVYIAGNHDEFSGWHIASWLQAYYRSQENLHIDISPEYTKYIKYSDSAFMFNHGDDMKPEKMAQVFPIGFKENWSSCNNFYIFSGDKHTELTREIGGIKFFRVSALSGSRGLWDSKKGYDTKGEMTAFLIEENIGMTDIYKL